MTVHVNSSYSHVNLRYIYPMYCCYKITTKYKNNDLFYVAYASMLAKAIGIEYTCSVALHVMT